jgi:lysine 2,3-aminomutase
VGRGGIEQVDWRQSLKECIVTADELAQELGVAAGTIAPVSARYPLRITRHYLGLIREAGDPIWRQCVPDERELQDSVALPDPLNEQGLSPVPGLIHRYPDRVVWVASNVCAVYCRFCMRKRQVGCPGTVGHNSSVATTLAYIRETPVIRDVILSGGDPLLLDDDRLGEILSGLRAIPHVEMVRIGTRVPVTLPERITPALCALLGRHQPLYVNTHFNHPREVTLASRGACARLADAGIPLGNQTVLMKGVNDDPLVMAELFRALLTMRVRPYYLHQMDLVRGTHHFRTKVEKGLEIMASLRGHVSGMAVPYYVVDLPGGKGKVPLLPGASRSSDGSWRLVTYTGETVEYRDL